MSPICQRCGVDVDAFFWAESGMLCPDCLADNALPLIEIPGGDDE